MTRPLVALVLIMFLHLVGLYVAYINGAHHGYALGVISVFEAETEQELIEPLQWP